MPVTLCARCRPLVSGRRAHQLLASVARRNLSNDAVVFSGIQPTGIPHLGNYLGALRQWKRLQDEAPTGAKLLFSIVDLHAITMPQDAPMLMKRKRELLASLLAIGLDPEKSILFYQSSVPAHAELMWILSCTASMGYLGRMTQWKSKLLENDNRADLEEETAKKLKLGLFSYPVLQAADILVHRATHVPVGDDQKQHLEFARECATNFNHAYGPHGGQLIAPETITTPSPRVMSLAQPHKKMSKSSLNEKSRIMITAREDEIRRRIKTAVTDSLNSVTYEPETRPGVANLLELLAQCDPRGMSPAEHAAEMAGAGLGDLKARVADAVAAELDGVYERYMEFLWRDDGRYLADIQMTGATKAQANAEETMRMVRDAVGLSAV